MDDRRQRRKFLELIGVKDAAGWHDALECMIEEIRACIQEEGKRHSRKSAREKLAELSELAERLIKLTGDAEVLETLRIYAPASISGLSHAAVNEYVAELMARARNARARISTTPGDRGLTADLGQPAARLLCAMMTCESWTKVMGKPPGEKNPKAHEACEALWVASGGTPEDIEGGSSRWVRHLHAAKDAKAHGRAMLDAAATPDPRPPTDPKLTKDRDTAAFLRAQLCVSDCLKQVQRERP